LAEFGEFHTRFTAYLTEYGHRETVSLLLVTSPTMGESPEVALGLITALAAGPPADTDPGRRPPADLPGHWLLRDDRNRARLGRWVVSARAGVAFREDSHFYLAKPLPVLRRSLLEIGVRLHRGGVLEAVEEVFHLRLEEIEAAGDPSGPAGPDRERLRAAVRARSARRAELAGVRLIDPDLIYPPRGGGDALVVGAPASAGTAAGPVVVVRGPAEFAKLTRGDVLVCPYTNPSWTPLFQRAAAVVVDAGGLASHAAIVAREYGIPAVMGTGDGTTVLTDGLVVTVNGGTGRVTAGGS
jgi:pyruvate,water dikinase